MKRKKTSAIRQGAFAPIIVAQGLAAKEMVLPGEKKTDLLALRDQVHADLRPVGQLENALTDRVVLCLWRLRRVLRVEAGYMDHAANDTNPYGPQDPFGRLLGSAHHFNKLNLLTRYEASVERSMFQALHELRELQKDRIGILDAEIVE